MATPQPSKLLRLPDELLDHILTHLDDGTTRRVTSDDLRSLALTCTRFPPLVRPRLLHGPVLHTTRQLSLFLAHLVDLPATERRRVRWLFVEEGCACANDIADLLRLVGSTLTRLSLCALPKPPADSTHLPLEQCTSLTDLSLSYPNPSNAKSCQAFLSSLSSVRPRLDRFHLTQSRNDKPRATTVVWPATLTVDSFVTDDPGFDSDVLLCHEDRTVLSPMFSSLRTLDIPAIALDPSLLYRLSPTLEALTLDHEVRCGALDISMPRLRLVVFKPPPSPLLSAFWESLFDERSWDGERGCRLLRAVKTFVFPCTPEESGCRERWAAKGVDKVMSMCPERWREVMVREVSWEAVPRLSEKGTPDLLCLLETGEYKVLDWPEPMDYHQ